MMRADFDSTVFARLGEKESKKRSAVHFPKRYRKWALSSANLKTALPQYVSQLSSIALVRPSSLKAALPGPLSGN